jgi:hypothetical protein
MKFNVHNPATRAAVTAYITTLPEKSYDVTITPHRERRSLPQNSLYWLWIACIADETGADRNQVHDEMKAMLLPRETVRGLFGDVPRPVSTSKLDTAQFTAYLEKVEAFALTDLDIRLPKPGDAVFDQFEEKYSRWI